jgi:hypothetical protein
MLPTENYALFQLATDLGKTVRELLDTPGPLTCMERYLWRRWKMARHTNSSTYEHTCCNEYSKTYASPADTDNCTKSNRITITNTYPNTSSYCNVSNLVESYSCSSEKLSGTTLLLGVFLSKGER